MNEINRRWQPPERRHRGRRETDIHNAKTLEDIKNVLGHIDSRQTEIEEVLFHHLKSLPAQLELTLQRLVWRFIKQTFRAALALTLMIPTWILVFQSYSNGVLQSWSSAFGNLFSAFLP